MTIGETYEKDADIEGNISDHSAVEEEKEKLQIYMFTRGNPSALVVEFLDFVTGPEGQALVKDAKFAPVPQKQ